MALMVAEIARIRPRGRADVQVRLERREQVSRIIVRAPDGEPMPLTAIGYFAFLQMDGETPLSVIAEQIDGRFEGAGIDINSLCHLVERLQERGLLFEDRRAVSARRALRNSGIGARKKGDPITPESQRQNEDIAQLVHAGWAALVGSEFPRAVRNFRAASERLPASLRLARLAEVVDRVAAGEQGVGDDPWIGIDRVVEAAVAALCCPACGGDLRQANGGAYHCAACDGSFQR